MRLKALCVGGATLAAVVLPFAPASAAPGDAVTTALTQAVLEAAVWSGGSSAPFRIAPIRCCEG